MKSQKRPGRQRTYDRKALCFWCFVTFERYPGKQKNKRTFCSRECYLNQLAEDNLSKRVNQHGGLTEEERLKISRQMQGRRKGPPNPNTYEKTLGRHTHRIVMEKMIGRPLKPGEVVHHIDNNKRNNKPGNLMLFASQAEHLAWHRQYDPRYGGDAAYD